MELLQLFCFASTGARNQFGYGTAAEAHEYASQIASEYTPCALTPTADVGADGIAFSIREALAVLHEGQEA
jgi:hypothetical protein